MTAFRAGDWRDTRVLVTGGLGFIGSNLALRLFGLGCHVTVLDSLVPAHGGSLRNLGSAREQINVVVGDQRDETLVGALLSETDVVFNLAGQVAHADSMRDPLNDAEYNYRTHVVLLEQVRHQDRRLPVVFTNTRQVYGRPLRIPVDESHPLIPTDVNGIHKLAAEHLHRIYHEAHGVPTVILRLTNTYGPRMALLESQGFIGWFLRLALSNQTITVFDDGNQLRDLNYVADVVDALLVSASRAPCHGEAYNLGGLSPVAIGDIARTVVRLAGMGEVTFAPFPPERKRIDIGGYVADWSKVRSLGWQPRVDLEQGLKETIRHYRGELDAADPCGQPPRRV